MRVAVASRIAVYMSPASAASGGGVEWFPVEAEIRPEPGDAERRAILAALGDLEDERSPYASEWRSAALEDEDQTVAPVRRSSRGAARA